MEEFDTLNEYEKFLIHKESLLHVQEIFYRVMERNPSLFRISKLLSLRKRRLKNAVGSENDLQYVIEFKPYKKGPKDKELYNSLMVSFKIFLKNFGKFIFFLIFFQK